MNTVKAKEQEQYKQPLIRSDAYYVMVSHRELDDLIARLMHLAELDSDKEHRDALKGEIKQRTRNWLDNIYADSGWTNYGLNVGAKVIDIEPKTDTTQAALNQITETVVA